METKTIAEAIIIVMVIVFLVLIPSKGGPIVKTLLNMDEDIIPQVTPDSVKQEFQNIINSYEECFNSNKDNCICNTNLLLFPSDYFLSFYNPNSITLERSGNPVIDQHYFNNKKINCYITYKEIKKCGDCSGVLCDEKGCNSLDYSITGSDCYFTPGAIGGDCLECPKTSDECKNFPNLQWMCEQCDKVCKWDGKKCSQKNPPVDLTKTKEDNIEIKYISDTSYLPLDTSKRILLKPAELGTPGIGSTAYSKKLFEYGIDDPVNSANELIIRLKLTSFIQNLYALGIFLDNQHLFYKKDNNICFVLLFPLNQKAQNDIQNLPKC